MLIDLLISCWAPSSVVFSMSVIYRLPREKSIVTPRSSCPHCGPPSVLRQHPLVSYLILRGQVQGMRRHVLPRYLMVELLTAMLYVAVYWVNRIGFELFVGLLFVSILIVISFIDSIFASSQTCLSLGGLLVGIGLAFLRPRFSYVDALLGILVGGGVLWAIAFLL